MAIHPDLTSTLADALNRFQVGFQHLPPLDGREDLSALRDVLLQVVERLADNDPYHHPFYLGQMMKPPHPIAWLAYALASSLNPNNHALDGGRASSEMEKEAVAQIAKMFSWETHLGHLTSGGTMANFEALWIARERRPDRGVAASSQAHYTHPRLSAVLQVPFQRIEVDARGRMDVEALELALATNSIGTVVATLGTTAVGAVDPLDSIVTLRDRFDFHLHVDAAYGGYYALVEDLEAATRRAFDAIVHADSIAIDPHKHGLQPYGCGCILFRDSSVGRFYRHDSPYTYFSSNDLHLGEISLECSRAGASAVALWATQQMLPIVQGGEFARNLGLCRQAAQQLYQGLLRQSRWLPLFAPELDIVVWICKAATAQESSRLAKQFFNVATKMDLHLALAEIPRGMVAPLVDEFVWDAPSVTCLRSCLMKPEHFAWMPEILDRLDRAADACFKLSPEH